MKKSLLFVLLFMVSILVITGCGSNLSKYAGTYKLEYSKYVGDPDTAKNTEEWTITLSDDASGKSNRNGSSYNIEWSISGNEITLTEKFGPLTIDYNGTITGNKLDIFNGDKTNDLTLEAVFNKQ